MSYSHEVNVTQLIWKLVKYWKAQYSSTLFVLSNIWVDLLNVQLELFQICLVYRMKNDKAIIIIIQPKHDWHVINECCITSLKLNT